LTVAEIDHICSDPEVLPLEPLPKREHPPTDNSKVNRQQPFPFTAGCQADKQYSSAYDVVFMSFLALYEQASSSWHHSWKQHSPEIASHLAESFHQLSCLSNSGCKTHVLKKAFSNHRDNFRIQLCQAGGKKFPEGGGNVSAKTILGVIFGGNQGPYLKQSLLCSECQTLTEEKISFPDLCAKSAPGRILSTSLEQHLSLFIQDTQNSPHQQECPSCNGENKVREVKIPGLPWFWLNRARSTSTRPCLDLTFTSPSQHFRYSLRSVIYLGEKNRYSARFRDRLGKWWSYDSLARSGSPVLDDVQDMEELCHGEKGEAVVLIYLLDS
jgi:hypothetical protein